MNKKYKLVTGWYPSEKTALKVLNKVKGRCKNARIEKDTSDIDADCYSVILFESDNSKEVDLEWSKCMKDKIYCGIVPAQ